MVDNKESKRELGRSLRCALSCMVLALCLAACMGLMGCGSNASSNDANSSANESPVESTNTSAPAPAGDISVQVKLTESVSGEAQQDSPLQFSDEEMTVSVSEGAMALDALMATGREVKTSGSGDSVEIVSIGGLENGSAGDDSHWEYARNGEVQAESPAVCPLSDGDVLIFNFVH